MAGEGLEQFKRNTSRKLAELRCPDHKQPPRLTFRGASLRDVSIQVSACCEKLSAMANQRLAAPEVTPFAARSLDRLSSPGARE